MNYHKLKNGKPITAVDNGDMTAVVTGKAAASVADEEGPAAEVGVDVNTD